jgi:hypothetical protein
MANVSWRVPGTSDDWSILANWTELVGESYPGQFAGAADNVTIGASNSAFVVVTFDVPSGVPSATIGSLTIEGGNGGSQVTTLRMTAGNTLNIVGGVTLLKKGSPAAIDGAGTISVGGAISFAGGPPTPTEGTITAGTNTTGGVLDLTGTSFITSPFVFAIGTAAPSTLEFNLAGGVAISLGSGTSSGSLNGFGTVVANLTRSGSGAADTITASGGTLDLTGTFGAGLVAAINAGSASTLKFDNIATSVAAAQNVTRGTAILTVGPGQQYTTIEAAVAAANPGDTVDVQAGIYTNDFVSIFQNLTLQAVGGPVQMVATVDPPNGKAIIDEGGPGISVTINGFDISGAVVPDGNGAAVRYEGGSLTLNNDYFHNNQDGMLAASDPNGTITINNSEFAFNGTGDGQTHNLYVNNIALLTITDSYFHDANVGHEIKSRAEDTVITDSRIFDLLSTASYSIDLPNGGNATITNNVIEQGPNTQNPYIIAYGEEGQSNPGTTVSIADNTIVNDDPGGAGILNPTSTPLSFTDNSVYGLTDAQLSNGPLAESGTTFLTIRPTLDTSPIGTACYARGTMILTDRGEVPIEDVSIGDRVVTLTGEARPIRWIGRRAYDVRFVAGNRTLLPTLIRQGALGDGVPRRDLYVSPKHAMFLDDVLVPAERLVNGVSIVHCDTIAAVEYFHIELDTHDIILAEGAPSESFVDCDNRFMFQNAHEFARLYPDCDAPTWTFCAPRIDDGDVLKYLRWRLDERLEVFGCTTTFDPDLHLVVDSVPVLADRVDNTVHVFRLQSPAREVRIVSRSSVPAELDVAFIDIRRLGVNVSRVILSSDDVNIVVGCRDTSLVDGFHASEESHRWTDGDARIPAKFLACFDKDVTIEVHVLDYGLSYRAGQWGAERFADDAVPAGGTGRPSAAA